MTEKDLFIGQQTIYEIKRLKESVEQLDILMGTEGDYKINISNGAAFGDILNRKEALFLLERLKVQKLQQIKELQKKFDEL